MGAGEISSLLLFFTSMGYYINKGWELSPPPVETIEEEDLSMSVLKKLFDISYEEDGTILITVDNVYKIVNGMFNMMGVVIDPADALECIMTFNEDVRDGQL